MAKCTRCGKKGLFLKLDHGLCSKCQKAVLIEATKMSEEKTINRFSSKPQPSDNVKPSSATKIALKGHSLMLHPDLQGLIWFADGPLKNYDASEKNYSAQFAIDTEPSAIQTKLAISFPKENAPVESLGYFPSYADMEPKQRGKYILFLANPYQEIDIGYVFVLYYGLERHLLYGNCERAFDVILKLRDVHRNVSFQQYSASALIYTAMHKKSRELYLRFTQSIDKQFEEEVPLELLLRAKAFFGIDIQPAELMKHAGKLGFSNKRYITSDHDVFEQELSAVLTEKYGKAAMPIQLINLSVLPTHQTQMVANGSLGNLTMDLPDITEAYSCFKITSEILQEAHNRVKAIKHPKKS